MIRVLLAEDQGMMRGALALLLGMEDGHRGGRPGGGRATPSSRPRSPHARTWPCWTSSCPAAAVSTPRRNCATRLPDCRVLILTTFGRPGYLRRAMEAGAAGFLVKDGPVEELAEAIRRVLRGETVIDPALAAAALSAGPSPLPRASGTC